MKKSFAFFLLFLASFAFSENKNLSSQLSAHYSAGFYPGVVRIAEEILRTEKDSLAAFRASVYEGESLFRMGRVQDAISVLEAHQFTADALNPESIQLSVARFYWLGRSYFSQGELPRAQNSFFSCASLCTEFAAKTAENLAEYYAFSLLYGGNCYFAASDFKNAVPLFEYVISHGEQYSLEDYEDSALALAQCYNSLGGEKNAQKCVQFVSSLENAAFNSNTKDALLVLKGEAQEMLGDYREAQNSYRAAGAEEKAETLSVWLAVSEAEEAYQKSSDKTEGSKAALEIIQSAQKKEKSLNIKNTSLDESLTLSLARYNGFLKNWKECEKNAEKCVKSENAEIKKNALYWYALSKYESGKISDAVAAIENFKKTNTIEDAPLLTLYAKSLAKQGKYHEADEIFYSLGEKNQLDNDGRLDYSRTLLIAGHYASTKEQAAKATGDEAVYLAALASFNQHNWREAESGFSKVLSSKTLASDYIAFAHFYAGYAEYQLGDYEKAIVALSQFSSDFPYHQFAWSAQMTLARAAAFAKNESRAISAAEQAVKTARNESEKNEAIILSAGILSDSKKYDDALALLFPHRAKRTEFGYECKYRSAEILAQQGKTEEADALFAELASSNDKNARLLAEESAYRRAEIAYANGDFGKAADLFENYGKKFSNGRFHFAAIYFSTDALAKSGDETKAILRYLQIVDSKSETSYRYGSEKNLVELYQKTGDIGEAIAVANRMIEEYGEQAVKDGMRQKIKELQNATVWNANSEEDRIKTAEKNLAVQKNDARKSNEATKNALFLAGAYRNKGKNRESALMYLDAAKYARQAGNDESAARAFYGAVEAFDAAGLYADEKATFTELKKLYPENAFTKEAEKIAGEL